MKLIKFKHTILLLVVLTPLFLKGGDVFDSIASAMQKGNAKEVARFFNSSVELIIPGSEDIFSKNQAELVLKDFFAKYPPKAFSIKHRSSPSGGSKYVIGSYISGSTKFRTYIFVKEVNGTSRIQELRLEKE